MLSPGIFHLPGRLTGASINDGVVAGGGVEARMPNKRRWAAGVLAVFWLLMAGAGFMRGTTSPPARWPAFLAWLPISPLVGMTILIVAAVIVGLFVGLGPLLNRRDRSPHDPNR
jgi:hypothetical protein